MSRIDDIFSALRADRRKALMPFLCGGHPAPDLLPGLLAALQRGGASIVEIGFPFSDPIADGPIIAAAMNQVLSRGGTPTELFDEIARARPSTSVGLVAMLSVSIIWRVGLPEVLERAARAGIDGFIVPDLPVEESGPILGPMRDAGFSTSLLIAPATPPQRAERIARASSGFVYLLARAGITGESGPAPDIAGRVRMIRGMTDLPIACGFGISTAEHVRAVVRHADAAIVGSALVRRLADTAEASGDPLSVAETFTTGLAAGLAVSG
ncbi:MAG: tryptophan synthase subunit alpha [Phycisphaerales bacterium]|nr:tryptophan synthase subunit alpha [Phycisphaerales bacterium]